MKRHAFVLGFACLLGCGGGGGSSPDPTTNSISVTVQTPLRMGQTTQATGTAAMSNGQSQALTSGWQSDAPGVASVTSSGTVTGIANGKATIYIVSGGRQGQQLLRITPDYHGGWEGGLRITSCSQTGVFLKAKACDDNEVGFTFGYTLSLDQSAESLNARASYGDPYDFPATTAPIRADGTASFTTTLQLQAEGVVATVQAVFEINSTRVGQLGGTVSELWHLPNVAGEMRVVSEIVNTNRTSISPQARPGGTSRSLGALGRLRQ